MRQLLLSTTNPGKLKELKALLARSGWELLTPADIDLRLAVEETGCSYHENAALKARAFCRASELPALADDTGLEVIALDGAPGLHSARFVQGENASDAARRARLLLQLSTHTRPWLAQFRCSVVLAYPDGTILTAEGTCHGEIVPEERGEHGFGYDPIFLFPAEGKTMAELSMARKNRISHRAMAISNLLKMIPGLHAAS